MNLYKKISLLVFLFTIITAVVYFSFFKKSVVAPVKIKKEGVLDYDNGNEKLNLNEESKKEKIITEPISNARKRITKKPFGIEISLDNSPVQPERFSGFHTGTDFEIFESETNINVEIYAICQGQIKLKKYAAGYGGVIAQGCNIEDENVIIVYGHLNLSSIEKGVEEEFSQGEKIGILGSGYSSETDGERKHLHISIYRGFEVNILGYAQNKQSLEDWIDIEKYLQ